MDANDKGKQVGGDHYKTLGTKLQHWDIVHTFELDYFQGQITKYVMRHKDKNKLQDLQKAQHFLEKYIELTYPHGGIVPQGEVCDCGADKYEGFHHPMCPLYVDTGPGSAYVDQDK